MTTPTDCLENPEDWLWVHRPDGKSTVIGVPRLYELPLAPPPKRRARKCWPPTGNGCASA
jgi:hypothetical protein